MRLSFRPRSTAIESSSPCRTARSSWPATNIRKIVPGFWPATEWETRRRQALAGDFEARFAAAWWAIENGLTTEAAAELRELHALDPKHRPSARMAAVLDRLDEPCIDPDFARFQKALGIEASVARGPHVILLHQHSDAEADERIALLERVITGYHLLFAAQGIELSVPRQRLVSAWFADQEDYLAFLHSEDADAFATTRGYFHPTWKAVVALRRAEQRSATNGSRASWPRSATNCADFGEHGRHGHPRAAGFKIQLAGEPARTVGRTEARALIARLDGEITCETMLLDLDRRSVDLGTAAHEMIHQLASRQRPGAATRRVSGLDARRAGGAIRGDPRRPVGGHQPCPRPETTGLAADSRARSSSSAWSGTPGLAAATSATCTPRPGPWSIFSAPSIRSEFLTFIDLLRSPSSRGEPAAPPPGGDRVFDAFQRAFGTDIDRLGKRLAPS